MDGLCIAVRDRRTGQWLDGHLAVGRRLSGGVKVLKNGEAIPVEEGPEIGEALYFAQGGRELITSALCRIDRPSRELSAQFAA